MEGGDWATIMDDEDWKQKHDEVKVKKCDIKVDSVMVASSSDDGTVRVWLPTLVSTKHEHWIAIIRLILKCKLAVCLWFIISASHLSVIFVYWICWQVTNRMFSSFSSLSATFIVALTQWLMSLLHFHWLLLWADDTQPAIIYSLLDFQLNATYTICRARLSVTVSSQ